MDPFTQRMLERARARQEKIDQKLASSGQTVPKRKPLTENSFGLIKKAERSPNKFVKEPAKSELPINSPKRKSVQGSDTKCISSPQKSREVLVTKKEFNSPRQSDSSRKSDVSVEINILHKDNIQVEVQVEDGGVPMTVIHGDNSNGSTVVIKDLKDLPKKLEQGKETRKELEDMSEEKNEGKSKLRQNVKSRLDRLGVLYSDKADLSSPIHRTELDFRADTPPSAPEEHMEKKRAEGKGRGKFGRLAALADEINNWEDDLSHHNFQAETTKKTAESNKHDTSTLDVSIHSIQDINKVLETTSKSKQTSSKKIVDSRTFKKQAPTNDCQRLDRNIVAELESQGYRRVSAGQSRLVYDFSATKRVDPDRQEPKGASSTLSNAAAPKMATLLVSTPPTKPQSVSKKPSIKKYKAPTPPRKILTNNENCESDKDKENNVLQREENDNDMPDCIQTNVEPVDECRVGKGSPLVKKLATKLNGNVDRNSVLSKAAMFEAGSPKTKEKDPAEMSLRERKALFERNKGVAIVPKAPFGLAPSAKSLHGDNKADAKPVRPVNVTNTNVKTTPTKSTSSTSSTISSKTNSKDDLPGDNTSQTSIGGGIRGKLAALFNKEQTISETTIANKFKLEREREMEMLQNRFNYSKNKTQKDKNDNDSDEDPSEDHSEKAPLMGSSLSLVQVNKKPEIIANVPKVTFEDLHSKSETALNDKDRISSQPVKRRSSQDSPIVLSVLEDVKRIKVNKRDGLPNGAGAVVQQPTGLYPHLSDIETDTSASHTHDEHSDCGESSTDTESKLNKSDNWAETSFGRDVMNVVKKNSSYNKAIRGDQSDSSTMDSELDDVLDEALNDESEGPTPPKVNKNHDSLSSKSFTYKEGSPVKQREFKSPLKMAATPTRANDKGGELVHTVSFYRRMQNASSQPTTPLRVVRHASPEPAPAEPAAVTVRERIKELHAEIAKQQTVISQASQALNLCAATIEFSGSTEQAEGERLLLLASHRRQACAHEAQRLQVEGAGAARAAGGASLRLAALAAPLRRDYVRQLNADGAVGHHAVCLLKCRDRVLATSMRLTQPSAPALLFPDEIRMEGLTSDFKITVEVYLLQASKEILPHDVKYHISNKKSSKLLTPKSKGSKELKTPKIQSPAGPMAVRSPQFQLHGYCIFALPQANRKNFTLNKVPCGSPLEGSVSLEIAARVRVPAPAPHAAFLTAFDDVSGLGAWHRRWFQLQPPRLSYWKYPDDVHKKMPIGDIDLSSVVSERAERAPRELCARPHTLLLESAVPAALAPDAGSLVYARRAGAVVRRHLLAADSPRDRDLWLRAINDALDYVRCGGD